LDLSLPELIALHTWVKTERTDIFKHAKESGPDGATFNNALRLLIHTLEEKRKTVENSLNQK